MKSLIFGLLCIALSTSGVGASVEYIGLFTDVEGTSCSMQDSTTGVVTLYLVHKDIERESSNISFKLVPSPGFTGVWLGDEIRQGIHLGNTRDGVSISYVTCRSGDVLIGTVQYLLSGDSESCAFIEVMPIDSTEVIPLIAAADCDNRYYPTLGARLYVNSGGTCLCGIAHLTGEQQEFEEFLAGPPDELLAELQSACAEFGVPQDVLFATSFLRTHWMDVADDDLDMYGPMGLRRALIDQAASQIERTDDDIRSSVRENVRAAASLWATYLSEERRAKPEGTDLDLWLRVFDRVFGFSSPTLHRDFQKLLEWRGRQFDQGAVDKVLPPANRAAMTDYFCSSYLWDYYYGTDYWRLADSTKFAVGRGNDRLGWEYTPSKVVMHTLWHDIWQNVVDGGWQLPGGRMASAHYVITLEGEVVLSVCELNTAYHAGNLRYNFMSVGVEMEGHHQAGLPPVL